MVVSNSGGYCQLHIYAQFSLFMMVDSKLAVNLLNPAVLTSSKFSKIKTLRLGNILVEKSFT